MTDEIKVDDSAVRAVEETVYIYSHVADKLREKDQKIGNETIMSVFAEAMSFHRVLNTKRSWGGGGKQKKTYSNPADFFIDIYEEKPEDPPFKSIYNYLNVHEKWSWNIQEPDKSIIKGHIYAIIAELVKSGILEEKEKSAPTSKGDLITGFRLTKLGYQKLKAQDMSTADQKACDTCPLGNECHETVVPGTKECSDALRRAGYATGG